MKQSIFRSSFNSKQNSYINSGSLLSYSLSTDTLSIIRSCFLGFKNRNPESNKSSHGFRACMALICLVLLSACIASPPVPEAKKTSSFDLAWSNDDVDAAVQRIDVSIPSPAPNGNGQAPEQCDFINFLRFKLKSAPEDAAQADAVLVMMPGFIEGANAFEYIARQLVYIAKEQNNKNFEVWALDRRNNCLEDLTGMQAAEAAPTARQAQDLLIGYYYKNLAINGKTFGGFLAQEDLAFVSEFGLVMDINDVHTILTTMIPDQAQRKQKIFLGGHSQGGPLSTVYSGWDFDGNINTTDDVGYKNIAGLFGFDTSVRQLDPNSVGGDISVMIGTLFGVNLPIVGEFAYLNSVNNIRKNIPVLPIPGLTPEVVAMPEGLAVIASKAPEEKSTVLDEIEISDDVALLLNINYSFNAEDFSAPPFMSDYNISNEAFLASIFDEDFSVLGFVHTSLGHLNGGSVVKKQFPVPDTIKKLPFLEPLLTRLRFDEDSFIGNDAGGDILGSGPLYTWAEYHEIGDAEDTEYRSTDGHLLYTTTAEEMVDMQDFMRTLYIGSSNLTEWYYSTRRLVDIAASTQPYAAKYGLNYLHGLSADMQLPSLDLVAGNSNSRFDVAGIDGIHEIVVIPGMEHLDPMMAIANRPDYYQNPVIPRLIDFVLENQL